MKISQVIVVEGKHDSAVLKKYFNCDTLETSGTHLSKATLKLIKIAHEKRGVIVFTDPDVPGNKIRQKINEAIPGVYNAFIAKDKAKTTKKVGIEHANKADLEEALQHLICCAGELDNTLSYASFNNLGLNGQPNSKALRQKVGNALFVGEANAKTLWKRLNMLKVNEAELKQLIEELL